MILQFVRISFILISVFVVELAGEATVQLKIVRFSNQQNRLLTGELCKRGAPCNTFFTTCLGIGCMDEKKTSTNAVPASLIRDSQLQPNPVSFTVIKWPTNSTMQVNVTAIEKDSNKLIASFQVDVVLVPLPSTRTFFYSDPVTLTSKNQSLQFSIAARCSDHFYGPLCAPMCKSTSSYNCTTNGSRLCWPNYQGEFCFVPPACDNATNPCKNGGMCITSGSAFSCKCPPAFTGLLCNESRQSPCLSTDYCLHGGECHDLLNGTASCQCVTPYSGNRCQLRVTAAPTTLAETASLSTSQEHSVSEAVDSKTSFPWTLVAAVAAGFVLLAAGFALFRLCGPRSRRKPHYSSPDNDDDAFQNLQYGENSQVQLLSRPLPVRPIVSQEPDAPSVYSSPDEV